MTVEPAAVEPAPSEPAAFEPVAFEPVAFEPVAFEPVAFERYKASAPKRARLDSAAGVDARWRRYAGGVQGGSTGADEGDELSGIRPIRPSRAFS